MKNKATECLALRGKHHTDGIYIKQTFLSSADILFSDLPNQDIILFQIRDIPVSARSIDRRIAHMAEDITTKQRIGLQQFQVFSVAAGENTDLNDLSRPVMHNIARIITFMKSCVA